MGSFQRIESEISKEILVTSPRSFDKQVYVELHVLSPLIVHFRVPFPPETGFQCSPGMQESI